MSHPLKLDNGSRIGVVGGGPAGSFFALYLLHYAAKAGIRPEVTIYQQRDFCEAGVKGCKGCAGLLSLSLLKNLPELGLELPEAIIRSKIDHYTVHSGHTSIAISNPENIQIVSVYRARGPRLSDFDASISFDGWLLGEAEKRGTRVVKQAVEHIYLEGRPSLRVSGEVMEFDLVVLASGAGRVPVSGLAYQPPRTRTMSQDELYVGDGQVKSLLGNSAHAFLVPHSSLIFGTLVPKGAFVNVSVLSRGERALTVKDFLRNSTVRGVLGDNYTSACGCRPRAVVSSARNYYARGFVAVGDAVVSRLYKDGIGSSLLTAREAARTAVRRGIAADDFRSHYQPFCQGIDRDNRWGRLLFRMNGLVKDSRLSLRAVQRLIADEQNGRGRQPFTRATWGMFTGSYSYRSIAWMVLNPASLARFWAAAALEAMGGLAEKGRKGSRKLHIGHKKVLILGSGFGGAYVLRQLVPSLNRNENVETTMVSDENFFLFAPLLHEAAMGRVESRHIAYPLRRLHWRDRFNFVHASVERIDLKERTVMTTAGKLDYDYLVLALGSVTNMAGLNYAGKNLFTLKSLRDSILIRNHIIGVLERAYSESDPERRRQLLTFVVAGAGYTGVQLVTELRDYLFRSLLRFYRTVRPDEVRIILVEAEPKIIADLHTRLGAYAMKHLREMGIEVRLKSRLTRVWEDIVVINNREKIPTSTVIWVAGVVSNPRIAEIAAEKDGIGRVIVNDYLEVPSAPGVYALGDCAHFPDPLSGQPIPPRAHTAVRQARVVAHNILAEIRGRDRREYRYSNNAEIVSLGSSKAVFRYRGLRVYGLPARLIWLAAYSLLVTGKNNRIRIVVDWLLAAVFGRDIAYIRINPENGPEIKTG
ncbi:MAG: FAD-dependent oxidoreductase [Chloroflexi bacterium]|nr:FAD-dependent oxidoreductase [Chloroflexota bacterium]